MADNTIRDDIPDEIYRSIASHLIRSAHRAEDGYESVEEDEDSITGDFLRAIRKTWSKPTSVNEAIWRWRVTTRKFRGRGELATESLIGADGVVQVEVTTPEGEVKRKGLLFQAKNDWRHRDATLLEQLGLMQRAAPGGSAVFDYSSLAYRGFTPDLILRNNGRPGDSHPKRLGEFLAEDFLECHVGRRDLWYDWDRKGLTFELPLGIQLTPKFLAAIQIVGERAFLTA